MNLSLVAANRGEVVFSFLRRIIIVLVMVSVWSLTNSGENAANYLGYFSIFYFIFDSLTTGRAGGRFVKDVLSGNINTFLLKPIYYPFYRLFDIITIVLSRLTLPIGLLIIAIVLFPQTFGPASFLDLLIFIPTSILSVVLFQIIMITIANLSFWFGNISFIFTVYGLIVKFVNGGLIPISEYSKQVQDILFFLPTSYGGGIETNIYLGRYPLSQATLAFIIVLFWTVSFMFVNHRLYLKGLSKLEAVGG